MTPEQLNDLADKLEEFEARTIPVRTFLLLGFIAVWMGVLAVIAYLI